MSQFQEIALRNGARGFRVFPVHRGTKQPCIKDFPELATTEPSEAWAAQFPDANCGVMGDDVHLILDTDRWDKLQELFAGQLSLDPTLFDTYCVSARDNRRQFAFLQTERSRSMKKRNLDYAVPGEPDNVFEFKSWRKFGMGEGSVHKTGAIYTIVQDRPIKPVPDLLITRAEELAAAVKPQREDGQMEARFIPHGEQHNELVRITGVMRQGGCDPAEILAALEVIAATRCEDDIPHEHLEQIANSAAKWPIGTNVSVIVTSETAPKLPQKQRPLYPIEVWDQTAVGEFAKLCAHDNNIPRKLYAESFRTVLGAILGNRVSCSVEGAIVRCYTIIIAPFGKGKGTAIRRATRFFGQSWHGLTTSPGLLSGARDFIWKSQGIGAWNAAASSVPGMAKLATDLEDTIKTSPHLCWGNTLPRILSVHEEMKTFFSTIFIENGVGTGMDGVICQLWDDVEFSGTATGSRDAQYGQMMFSILGGVTPDDWFDLISRGNAVGGGLMSRLNLIGTEGEYDNVPKMVLPDFGPLQESFFPRIKLLADAPVRITADHRAESVMAEWADTLPEGSERMNVQAWRSALLLAWLRREQTITPAIAQDAVRLGQYQVDSQEFYRVAAADSGNAKIQAKMMRTLSMHGPMSKRQLQKRTHAERVGTSAWEKALAGLIGDLRITFRDGRYEALEA